mmetsp:Transcript_2220/g.5707  ORF Transcript_2220/g.5707 Transcript_2220/m.5707 type:complete len:92 (-) Transcript_2220:39-314(-)
MAHALISELLTTTRNSVVGSSRALAYRSFKLFGSCCLMSTASYAVQQCLDLNRQQGRLAARLARRFSRCILRVRCAAQCALPHAARALYLK